MDFANLWNEETTYLESTLWDFSVSKHQRSCVLHPGHVHCCFLQSWCRMIFSTHSGASGGISGASGGILFDVPALVEASKQGSPCVSAAEWALQQQQVSGYKGPCSHTSIQGWLRAAGNQAHLLRLWDLADFVYRRLKVFRTYFHPGWGYNKRRGWSHTMHQLISPSRSCLILKSVQCADLVALFFCHSGS